MAVLRFNLKQEEQKVEQKPVTEAKPAKVAKEKPAKKATKTKKPQGSVSLLERDAIHVIGLGVVIVTKSQEAKRRFQWAVCSYECAAHC